jgi:hypothetical protein
MWLKIKGHLDVPVGPNKWLALFACAGFILLSSMFLLVYSYDTYSYYRIKDNRLKINASEYLNPGIAKHAQYDAVLIGSSVVQNFDMDLVNSVLGSKTIKLTVRGMTDDQRADVLSLVNRERKPKKIIYGFDLFSFDPSNAQNEASFPRYLYNESWFDDFRYIYGYENWFRFMPASILYEIGSEFGAIPKGLSVSVDCVGQWDAECSKAVVQERYAAHSSDKAQAFSPGLRRGMLTRVESLIDELDICSEWGEVIVIFPPYSSLYWHELKLLGKYDVYVDIKRLACARMIQNPNIRVLDFQGIEQTTDLDHYMDSKHYDDLIYSLMTKELNQGAYRIKTEEDVDRVAGDVGVLLEAFQHENQEWL